MLKERLKNAWDCLRGNPPRYIEYQKEPWDVSLERVGSIDEKKVRYLRDMSGDEYREHRSEMSYIAASPNFQKELETLKMNQVYNIATQQYDEKWHFFAKGTLNGIGLVQDRFNNLFSEENDYQREKRLGENFDPFDTQIYE
jgi:hypothetical protein